MSIDQTTLEAQVRDSTGKGVAHRLRAKALIPAVVYGPHAEKPLNISVDPKALRTAIQTPHRLNTLITLQLGAAGQRMALLRDVQQHPVSRELLHADFYEVSMGEKIRVPVPVELVGRAAGQAEGGILQQVRRELTVECLPKDIPLKIEVDVTPLQVTDTIHVAEVKPPPGCVLKFTQNYVVALVAVPEKEEVAAPVVAAAAPGAAPAAGAAAPAADGKGAAPAKGGAAPAAAAKAPAKK